MIVVYLGIGWFVGLWAASYFSMPLIGWLTAAGIAGIGTVVVRRYAQQGCHELRWLFTGLLAAGLGGARYVTAVPIITDSHIAHYNDGQNVTLTGLVIGEPDVRDRFVNLRVAMDRITLADGTTQPVHGTALVRTFRFPVIGYGTQLEVNGRLETPPEFDTFSYKDYLARQGIHSLINTPDLIVLAENAGSPIKQAIFTFKARAQTTINRLIPDPQAALLSGILLGDDNGIAPDLADDFRNTGMTHIIAISGDN